jgi:hypothetical protein
MAKYHRVKVHKGMLGNVKFQYNPAEFDDVFGVDYTELKGAGMSYPIDVYSGGKGRRVSFTIQLDGVEKPGSVRKMVNELNTYVPKALARGEYQFFAPPPIIFTFGWFVKECYLEEARVKYTMFTPDLMTPLRADVQVTLRLIQ